MQEDLHGGSAEIRGKKMRESFVFHAEYIEDLPDSYKADFSLYTVTYGLYGEEPPLMDGSLELSLWKKIARRIDAETERYQAISAKRREAAQKRYAQKCGDNAKATPPAAKNAIANFVESAEAKAEQKKQKKTFEKPTVSEIAAYCKERRNVIDAQAFYDFYESKGWKVGAVKMKDWRACVRTWEQRRKADQTGGKKAGGMWGKENEIPDEITDLF
jgi:hypothetical protein